MAALVDHIPSRLENLDQAVHLSSTSIQKWGRKRVLCVCVIWYHKKQNRQHIRDLSHLISPYSSSLRGTETIFNAKFHETRGRNLSVVLTSLEGLRVQQWNLDSDTHLLSVDNHCSAFGRQWTGLSAGAVLSIWLSHIIRPVFLRKASSRWLLLVSPPTGSFAMQFSEDCIWKVILRLLPRYSTFMSRFLNLLLSVCRRPYWPR